MRARRAAPLVGRGEVLADITTLLATALEGRSGILLLEGRAGEQPARRCSASAASASGIGAVHGAGDELEQRRPFGVIADALGAARPERWRRAASGTTPFGWLKVLGSR